MKTRLIALLMFVVAGSMWTQLTQAQEPASKPVPLEAFYCDLKNGKTLNDLTKVADRFSKWAESNHSDYSAWILTPQFGQFDELPQVLWLGSNTSGNALGKGLDAYLASGGDIQKEFNSIVSCDAHVLASSVPINAPDGPPGDGVVMFTQCSFSEGSDWTKAIAAHKKYSAAMRDLGAKNSNWIFFPMLGGSAERDFDYWGVATFPSWTEYFAAYELYVNAGGWKKSMEIMNGVASCEQGTPTVWDVKLVRQRSG